MACNATIEGLKAYGLKVPDKCPAGDFYVFVFVHSKAAVSSEEDTANNVVDLSLQSPLEMLTKKKLIFKE